MLDQELLAKAEANDVQAIFEVAKAYYIGDGVEENNEKAFELFSKVVALDPNFPDVYSRIGRCYEKGWGTAQDLKKAVDAYTTGANLNSAGCHYYLALAYENGTDVYKRQVMCAASVVLLLVLLAYFSPVILTIAILVGLAGSFLLWRRIVDMGKILKEKKRKGKLLLKQALDELTQWRKAYKEADAQSADMLNAIASF